MFVVEAARCVALAGLASNEFLKFARNGEKSAGQELSVWFLLGIGEGAEFMDTGV